MSFLELGIYTNSYQSAYLVKFSLVSIRFATVFRQRFAKTKRNMCLGKRHEETLFRGEPYI
jgi:hypothetical protein